MALPYISHCNFEDGTKGHFTSETDTTNRLDIAHYSELARIPGLEMPFNGAYCLRLDLGTSNTDAFLQEDTLLDLAASGSIWFRFRAWIDPNIAMANATNLPLLTLQSAGPVAETVVGLRMTGGAVSWALGETAPTSRLQIATLGEWQTVELSVTLDSGAPNDGISILYVDGVQVSTALTGLDQAALTQVSLGVVGQNAGVTGGIVLIDDVISDDTRIYGAFASRFNNTTSILKSQHLWVGPGELGDISLISGGTDNVLKVWDTDIASTNDPSRLKCELRTSTANEVVPYFGPPIKCTRGCYVEISGTASAGGPRAIATIKNAVGWGSAGAVRNYGSKRFAIPSNAY